MKKTLFFCALFALAMISIFVQQNTALFINDNGNVGIGTETPTETLEVNGRIKDKTGFIMPVGSILPYYGETAPEGWLLCNGDPLPQEPEYDELRDMVGGTAPDLRGVFLRGVDNGRDLDPDRDLGSYQEDLMKNHQHQTDLQHQHTVDINHYHSFSFAEGVSTGGDNGNQWDTEGGNPEGTNTINTTWVSQMTQYGANWHIRTTNTGGSSAKTSANPINNLGGAETRPKNVAVNYIIKY